MQIYEINHYKEKLPKLDESVCMIGLFDGIHLGHQELIKHLNTGFSIKKTVITFKNLFKDDYYLMDLDLKKEIFADFGIDYLIILDYNNFKNVFYNEFIKLLKSLSIIKVVVGRDFRFGFQKEGDLIDLENNFELDIVPDYYVDNIKISTKTIKDLLAKGDIESANKYLGRNYIIKGEVIRGRHVGTELGFKTANVDYKNFKLPKSGAYLVKVKVGDRFYKGIASCSHNPSINYVAKLSLEVHILNFNQLIYGEKIEIHFEKFLAETIVFRMKEDLIEYLNKLKNIALEND